MTDYTFFSALTHCIRQGGAPGGKTCRRWNHGSSLRVVINGAKPVAFTPARCRGKDSMPEKYRQRPYSY